MLPARVFDIAAEIAGPPTGSPPMRRCLPGGWRANKPRGPGCQRPAAAGCGLAWLGSGLALAGFWLGFRLDFGLILFGFRLRLDFGLILVWLDLDLASFRLDLAGFGSNLLRF